MRTLSEPSQLLEFDDARAYASKEWWQTCKPQLWARVSRAFDQFARQHGVGLEPEDPSGFQDGSAFTCAQEYLTHPQYPQIKTVVLGGFYFSRYGDRFTGGIGDERSTIAKHTWHAMTRELGETHGFIYVPEYLLRLSYDGEHAQYRRMTWSERYFAAWYQHLKRRAT